MPRLIDITTGKPVTVPESKINELVLSDRYTFDPTETYRVRNKQGKLIEMSGSALAAGGYEGMGFAMPTPAERTLEMGLEAEKEEYTSPYAQLAAGVYGLGRGATLGLSDVALRAMGAEEEVGKLRAYTPGVSLATELTGAVGPALISGGAGTAGALGRATVAGRAARITPGLEKALARRAGRRAARELGEEAAFAVPLPPPPVGTRTLGLALEGAAFGAGHGLSNIALSEDPFTVDAVVSEIGGPALYGAAFGLGIGVLGGGARRALTRIKNKSKKAAIASMIKIEAESAGANMGKAKEAMEHVETIHKASIEGFESRLQKMEDIGDKLKEHAGARLVEARASAAVSEVDDIKNALNRLREAENRLYDSIEGSEIQVNRMVSFPSKEFKKTAKGLGMRDVKVTIGGNYAILSKKDITRLLELDDDTLKGLYLAAQKYENELHSFYTFLDPRHGFTDVGQVMSKIKPGFAGDVDEVFKLGNVEELKDVPAHMKWKEVVGKAEEHLTGYGAGDKSALINGPYNLELTEFAKKGGIAELFENAMVTKKASEVITGPVQQQIDEATQRVAEKLSARHGMDKASALKAAEAAAAPLKQGITYGIYTMARKGTGVAGAVKGAAMAKAAGWVFDKVTSPIFRILGGGTGPQKVTQAFANAKLKVAKNIDRLLKSKVTKIGKPTNIMATKILAHAKFGHADPEYLDLWKDTRKNGSELQKLYVQRMAELSSALAREPATRQNIRNLIHDITLEDPAFAAKIEEATVNRLKILMAKMPTPLIPSPLEGVPLPPSDAEIQRWAAIVSVLEDPHLLYERVASGIATPEEAEVVKVAYPAIFEAYQMAFLERAAELRVKLPHSRLTKASYVMQAPLSMLADPGLMLRLQQNFMPKEMGGPPRPPPPSISREVEKSELTAAGRLQTP